MQKDSPSGGRTRRARGLQGRAATIVPAVVLACCLGVAALALNANRVAARHGLESRFQERTALAAEFLATAASENVGDGTPAELHPYLRTLIPIAGGRATLLDASGNVIASSELSTPEKLGHWSTGYTTEDGVERYVASADVVGTSWTLVTSAPRDEMLRPLEGGELVARALLACLAIAGGAVILLQTRLRTRRAELERRAMECPLTGLANRTLLEDRIAHALRRSDRSGALLGVLYLDMDDFKIVNDTRGHAAGDDLLRTAARRLESATRFSDTPARIGGDEFAVLLDDISSAADAVRVANRVLYELERPMDLGGSPVAVRASIGVVVSSTSGATASSLLRDADAAMYKAKNAGKGRIEVFEPEMRDEIAAELELESDLRGALARRELELHYQPIVDLGTSDVIAVEALLRWHHPVRGSIPPADFIPVAERNGLIVDLGRFVLDTACAQLRSWRDTGGPTAMSVNVSARQLRDPAFVDHVTSAMAEWDVDPRALTLEITETSLVHDTPGTSESLRRLKELGVSIAIDDFGAGYSSLAYLRRYPIDVLKVDRELVAGLSGDGVDNTLARAVVQLAQTLGLSVVAEGIEREDQLLALTALGCRTGQGFYFARPAPASEVASAIPA